MLTDLKSALRPAFALSLGFVLLLGLAYPLTLTGIGQLVFPAQANGSLITENGKVIGSTLIGQAFTGQGYFRGRPSAAGAGYDASASAGSNLGPTSQALADRVRADVALHRQASRAAIPADLVTTSASGLDPDISPAAALFQVERVARARGLTAEAVRTLVTAQTAHPLLGDPHVNVLALNRALDRAAARP
jgi:K+-transporting ATPase ATPase C chain